MGARNGRGHRRSLPAIGIPLLLALVVSSARAQSVVNGDMDGVADVTTYNGVTPPGWVGAIFGGTDLWDSTTVLSGTVWLPSNGGGKFVHGAGVDTGSEFIEQAIGGLVIGGHYEIAFEQTISDSVFGNRDVAGFWRVTFGGATLDAAVMPVPPFGVAMPWQAQTLTFTATAHTQVLHFSARQVTPPPVTWRAECGLDTVSVAQAGTSGAPARWLYTVGDDNRLRGIDIGAGCAVTVIGTTQDANGTLRKVRGLAWVPSLDTLIGITREGDVVRVDRSTGQTAPVVSLPYGDPTTEFWGALAFDGLETLYTANAFDGHELVAIKLPAFTTTVVGGTLTSGGSPRQILGLDFFPTTAPPSGLPDPVPGVLYGADRTTGSVVRVDTLTAIVSDVGGNLGVAAPQHVAFQPFSGTLFGLDDQGLGAADLTTYDFVPQQGTQHCPLPFEIVEQGSFPDLGWGGMAFAPPGAWSDQGCAVPGVAGDPQLVGTGSLLAGTTVTLDLTSAAPNAAALLFLAFSSTPVPFAGGMLKPVPFLPPLPATTSVAGEIPLTFTMPANVPPGTELWVQWAIADVAAVYGIALSNAVLGVTP